MISKANLPFTQHEGATKAIPYAAASEMIAARYRELNSWSHISCGQVNEVIGVPAS